MALKFDAKLKGGVALPGAHVRVDTVMVTKDRNFTTPLRAQLDETLDRIDAVYADAALQPLPASTDDSKKEAKEREADNERRAAARTELVGPLERKRDRLEERLRLNPNGATYWIVKLDVRVSAAAGERLDAPEFDVEKFREVRYVTDGAFVGIEYRPDADADVVRIETNTVDPTAIAYALLGTMPKYRTLAPAAV